MSKLCETGEQGGLTVGVRFVIMQQCRTLSDVTVESIDHLMNSRMRKRHLFVATIVLLWKVVTWLILPVVICLSQRLSHACLSINKFVL